jgi:hypothetical protein
VTELTVFQTWHLFSKRYQLRGFIPFWGRLKRYGWPMRVDAARGVVVSVPDEWDEAI